MTRPATDNQPVPDDRNATKPRSRRLLWRLVAVLVFLGGSTLALIGYRIHRRYTILAIVVDGDFGVVGTSSHYPDWMWNLLGDYMHGLESIEIIEIRNAPDEHLRLIKELNPAELDLFRYDDSDESVYRFPMEGGRQIAEMTRLKNLSFLDEREASFYGEFLFVVPEEALAQIARSSSLEELILNGVELTGSPFSALAGSSTITSIDLWNCSYPETDLSQLKSLDSLRKLTLGDALNATDQSILGIAELTQLEELTLDDAEVSAGSLQHLQNLKNLQSLSIDGYATLKGVRFADFKCLPNLKTLDLSGTDFDDEGARQLAGANRLKNLNLGGTKITDQGLRSLYDLNQLESLDISITGVTYEAVEAFKKAVPDCQVYKE